MAESKCLRSWCSEDSLCSSCRPMGFGEYQNAALRSFKPRPGLSEVESKAALGAMGLAGETGEVVEPVKKWFFHGKGTFETVREKLREEIGDVLWYLALLANAFDLDLGEIAEGNIKKLLIRYPERKE